MIDRKQIVAILIGLFVGSGLTTGGFTLSNRIQPAPIIILPPEPTTIPLPTSTPSPIQVFVNGEVNQPAVYELPPNSIVEQAINAAGGFTEKANRAIINLAQPLSNGVQVYIPAYEETAVVPITIVTEPDGNSAQSSSNPNADQSGLVNINTAGLDELDSLPGVGPSTAQKIIDHRDENGLFVAVESIMDVSGIGEAKFDQLKELITVEGE